MNKRKMNVDKKNEVGSNIVSNLIEGETEVNAKVGYATSKQYSDNISNSKDNKVKVLAVVLILLVIVGIVIYFIIINNQTPDMIAVENETIYDSAYTKLNFKENNRQKKLICTKKIADNKKYINEEETVVYYFDNENIVTSISHIYINLNDKFMEYNDAIYEQYNKLLKNDYKYDNVKTNIIKNKNEMLVTIMVDSKKVSENKLELTQFANYEEAKKVTIDNGYSCK